jgi:hypothetical protein
MPTVLLVNPGSVNKYVHETRGWVDRLFENRGWRTVLIDEQVDPVDFSLAADLVGVTANGAGSVKWAVLVGSLPGRITR